MDEVKAMGQAGETAVTAKENARTGLRVLRKKAEQTGEVAGQKLTERGLDPQQLGEAFLENAGVAREELAESTRRARKRMKKNAERTRKELAESAKQASKDAKKAGKKAIKEAADKVEKKTAKAEQKARKKAAKHSGEKHRKWPWLLAAGVAAGVAAYVVRARASQEAIESDLSRSNDYTPGAPEHNGSGQHAREDSPANKEN